MQRSIEAREYQASRNDRGPQAPNRKHGLRTYFEPTGIRVHDRTAEGSPELLTLRWTGVGRGASLAAVPAGEMKSLHLARIGRRIREGGTVRKCPVLSRRCSCNASGPECSETQQG
jgi:hypothetical protein